MLEIGAESTESTRGAGIEQRDIIRRSARFLSLGVGRADTAVAAGIAVDHGMLDEYFALAAFRLAFFGWSWQVAKN